MKYTTYSHYDLSAQKKNSLVIDKFYGVDYQPSQLSVANNHAVDIKNIIYKDNTNQKRKGYEQIFAFNKVDYIFGTETKLNGNNINGIYSFTGKDNKKHIIAHVGNLLFEINKIGKNFSYMESNVSPICDSYEGVIPKVSIEMNDHKSMAFQYKHRLFILDGKTFLVLSAENNELKLTKVEDSDIAYIPTTTIGIAYDKARVDKRTALDDTNLMSRWRKNKLVSGIGYDATLESPPQYYTYNLDTNVSEDTNDLNNLSVSISKVEG